MPEISKARHQTNSRFGNASSSFRQITDLLGGEVRPRFALKRILYLTLYISAPLVYCRVTFALLRLLLAHEEKEVFASLLTEDARELINNSTNVHDLKAVLALDLRLSIGVGANELEAEEKDPGEVISEDSVFGLISSEEQEDLDEAWRLISVSGSEHHERYLQLAYLTFTVALANAHGELPKWIAEFQESLW